MSHLGMRLLKSELSSLFITRVSQRRSSGRAWNRDTYGEDPQ